MNNIVKKVFRKKTIERINSKIKLFGIKHSYNVYDLLITHLIITLLLSTSLIIIKVKLIAGILIVLLYFFGIEYLFFDLRLAKRGKKLEKDALFYFQILGLTIESGHNLSKAIELTCLNTDSDLASEFKKVIEDTKMGKSLKEALEDLKLRIPSDTVNNIILNLLESNIYGNNMVDSLDNQLEYLNDKLLLDMKSRINKMPIKISLVSVIVFVPLILLIILSPIILNLIK